MIPNRPPLHLAVGEQVQVGQHDTQWPEFVFVTTSHGTGWVPLGTSRSRLPAWPACRLPTTRPS